MKNQFGNPPRVQTISKDFFSASVHCNSDDNANQQQDCWRSVILVIMIDNEQVSLAMIFCHPNLKEDYHPGLLNPAKIFWLNNSEGKAPIAESLLNPLLCRTSEEGLKSFQEWTTRVSETWTVSSKDPQKACEDVGRLPCLVLKTKVTLFYVHTFSPYRGVLMVLFPNCEPCPTCCHIHTL